MYSLNPAALYKECGANGCQYRYHDLNNSFQCLSLHLNSQ